MSSSSSNSLEGRAELFAAVSDPNHSYWIELSREARVFIRELNLFRVRQAMPLLFAAWEFFPEEEFVRTLKLISAISFRYTVISRLNTNDLEPVYHNAAKAVTNGEATGPAEVFEEHLKPIYVDDEKTRQDFALLTVSNSRSEEKIGEIHPRATRSGRCWSLL